MKRAHEGFALLEMLAAAFLLVVLMTVVLQVFSAVSVARREALRRAAAIQQAAGALERIEALAWDEITPERLAEITLAPSAAPLLADARLQATVSPYGPSARQVQVEVTWTGLDGSPRAPTRLSTFVFDPRGASP